MADAVGNDGDGNPPLGDFGDSYLGESEREVRVISDVSNEEEEEEENNEDILVLLHIPREDLDEDEDSSSAIIMNGETNGDVLVDLPEEDFDEDSDSTSTNPEEQQMTTMLGYYYKALSNPDTNPALDTNTASNSTSDTSPVCHPACHCFSTKWQDWMHTRISAVGELTVEEIQCLSSIEVERRASCSPPSVFTEPSLVLSSGQGIPLPDDNSASVPGDTSVLPVSALDITLQRANPTTAPAVASLLSPTAPEFIPRSSATILTRNFEPPALEPVPNRSTFAGTPSLVLLAAKTRKAHIRIRADYSHSPIILDVADTLVETKFLQVGIVARIDTKPLESLIDGTEFTLLRRQWVLLVADQILDMCIWSVFNEDDNSAFSVGSTWVDNYHDRMGNMVHGLTGQCIRTLFGQYWHKLPCPSCELCKLAVARKLGSLWYQVDYSMFSHEDLLWVASAWGFLHGEVWNGTRLAGEHGFHELVEDQLDTPSLPNPLHTSDALLLESTSSSNLTLEGESDGADEDRHATLSATEEEMSSDDEANGVEIMIATISETIQMSSEEDLTSQEQSPLSQSTVTSSLETTQLSPTNDVRLSSEGEAIEI